MAADNDTETVAMKTYRVIDGSSLILSNNQLDFSGYVYNQVVIDMIKHLFGSIYTRPYPKENPTITNPELGWLEITPSCIVSTERGYKKDFTVNITITRETVRIDVATIRGTNVLCRLNVTNSGEFVADFANISKLNIQINPVRALFEYVVLLPIINEVMFANLEANHTMRQAYATNKDEVKPDFRF